MNRALNFRNVGNVLFHDKSTPSRLARNLSPSYLTHHALRITHYVSRLTFYALALLFLTLGLPPTPARADGPFNDGYGYIGTDAKHTTSMAWGDVDGDGDLDLAVGNIIAVNQIFENAGGILIPSPLWESADAKPTSSVAWGDVDGDGDLDLAVGNCLEANQVFENVGGILSQSPLWESADAKYTNSVAWGDMDGDGDLDLAVGNSGSAGDVNQVFENAGGTLHQSPVWTSTGYLSNTTSVAWGDVDGDGDLDLAVGNSGSVGDVNQVFENVEGILSQSPLWESADTKWTTSVAWGDVDGDGDLDLAVGNDWGVNQVFENVGGILSQSLLWESADTKITTSVAWGDVDGDGDLDLAVGNSESLSGEVNQVFENVGGILNQSPLWESADAKHTNSVAWGDVDGDGDLDLAVGNRGEVNQIFENAGGILSRTPLWESAPDDAKWTLSVAWGDVDGDGDLDLAVGNYGEVNQVSENAGGTLHRTPVWTSTGYLSNTTSVAWGDVDGDGDLDLAVGNDGQVNQVFENVGEILSRTPLWESTPDDDKYTASVAWGDVDGDGDLDLAVGNDGQVNQVFENVGGILSRTPLWESTPDDDKYTASVAWGDVDGDGDLDLAVGNDGGVNQVFENVGGILNQSPLWESADAKNTSSVAWGDVNGDGDLDLAVGNGGQVNQVFENVGGILSRTPLWESAPDDAKWTCSVAWGDVDGDGDLDLAVGNNKINQVFENVGGTLNQSPLWESADAKITSSVAWGDVNGDGDLDLAVGNHGYVGDVNQVFENARVLPDDTLSLDITAPYTSSANFYAASVVLDSPTIPVTYTLFDPEEDRVGWIKTFYSPDGGGCWLPAVATVDTITEHLSLGSALTFDGDDDYVVVSPLVSAPSSEATVSFWMRSRDEAKTGTPLSYACSEQTNELLVFNYNNLTIYINGMSVSTGITATDGLWHHIAVAWRSSDGQIRLYKDGASVYSDTLAAGRMIHPGGALVLGQEQDSVGGGFEVMQAFSGTLDHVCMWNVMLSPVEIETNMRRAFTGNEPGLVFHWALDEGVGGMAFDRTANENDGVLGNGIEAAQPQWSNGFFATYVYTWSTFASGFFGQSDDVILRMVAYPQPAQSTITGTYKYYNSTPLYQHTYASATTFPFRVRGTQVRVYSETEHISNTVANAMVYRWSEGAGNRLLADSGGTPFRTDQHGYLQGRGEIGLGDRLLAMLPVSTVAEYAGELTFDGVDDTAFITPLNSMPIAETTVSFWINTTQGTGAPFSYASPITDATFLLTNPGDLTLWRGDTYSITTPVTVTDGLWHHLAVTWRSIDGQVKLYKDGVAAYTGTLAIDTVISPGGSLALGRDQDGGDFFKGRLDEVRIWKAVLTEDQILDEMYGLLDTNDSDLAASWSFDDPENPGTDASDNANDLTLSGATWAGDYLGGYTVYHTSGTPTTDGVDALTVSEPGVQVLTVTAQHPLVLFDLNVSLEWDAHNDPLYLQQLAVDLQRASAHLYDFTNGQVALGHVTVHQNADYWASSHIAVQATNHLRPFAHIGGLLTDIVTETVTIDGQEHTLTYGPGQIRMGATWNRYGDPTTSIGEDWPLILAHELSHYLLYQYDVYIGLNEDDLLVPQDTCTGSAMGDVYAIDNTEFISDTLHWTTACSQTLAAKTLGRTEWETLRAWYPWLITPTLANDGPSQMPFEFTTVEIVAPAQAQDTIEDPTFYLDYENGVVSSSEARAFLLRDADDVAQPGPDDFDYIYDLGSPIGGQNRVTARGARPGERLCVFDNTRAQFGCEIIAAGDERLTLKENAAWQPVIQLTPVNSTTFNIQVTGLVSEALLIKTRVYPEYGTAFTTTTLSYFPPVEGEVMGQYSGTLMLDYPAMSGHIQVWVDESASETSPRRETLVNYSIGGNPGPARAGGIGPARAGGIGPARAGGIGLLQAGEAPMVSPDGQMILYLSDVITFAEGQFFTIQTMAGLPDPPPGRTAVGPAYNLVATGFLTETPPLTGSLSIQYLGSDVLAAGVDENDLVIYFWDGSTWTVLDTVLNTPYNMASAPSQGTGIYALMAGVQTVLSGPGWNLMAYSVRGAQPVTQALLSISGYYTTVYGYEADDPDDPWKVYDVVAPEWVNDLTTLEFNHGYWINVSQTITLYLSNATALMASMLPEDSTLASPPDTFYGLLLGNTTFTPDVDMTVEARIKGTVCGRGITRAWEGQVVYVVDVFANDGVTSNCGNLGDTVMFFVAGQPMVPTAVWDNRQLNEITLKPAACVYLPLVLRVK